MEKLWRENIAPFPPRLSRKDADFSCAPVSDGNIVSAKNIFSEVVYTQ